MTELLSHAFHGLASVPGRSVVGWRDETSRSESLLIPPVTFLIKITVLPPLCNGRAVTLSFLSAFSDIYVVIGHDK
jgi:hypothetical protein